MIAGSAPWDAIAALVARLRDPTFEVRRDAGMRLAEWGEPAVPAVRHELATRDPRSARRAVVVLGEIGTPSAVGALLAFLPEGDADLDAARRAGLSRAAIRLAPRATVADILLLVDLLETLVTDFPHVSALLARALKRLAETDPHPALRQALPVLRRPGAPEAFVAAAHAIEPIPAPPVAPSVELPRFAFGVETLIGLLRHAEYATRKAAGERLAALGAAAVPALAAEIARRHPWGCPHALFALGLTGAPAAVEPLVAFDPGRDEDRTAAREDGLTALAARFAARRPDPIETTALVRLFGALSPMSQEAMALAQTIAWLARHAPTPALRAALQPLKGSWRRLTPDAFRAIHRAVDEATAAWKDLPVAAAGTAYHATDLPRPSEVSDAD